MNRKLIEKVRELIDCNQQLIDEAAEVAKEEETDVDAAHLVLKARAALEIGAVLSTFYIGNDAHRYSCKATYDEQQDLTIVVHSFE